MHTNSNEQVITVDPVSEMQSKVGSKKAQLVAYLKENYSLVTRQQFFSWVTQLSAKYQLYAKKYALLHPLSIILQQVSQVDTASRSYQNQRGIEYSLSGYMQLYILNHCLWLMLHSFPKISHEEGMRIADYPATDSNSPFRESSKTGWLIARCRDIVRDKMLLLRASIKRSNNLEQASISDIFKKVSEKLQGVLVTQSVDDCLGALVGPNNNSSINISACPPITFNFDSTQLLLTISGHCSQSATPRKSYSHQAFVSSYTIKPAIFVDLLAPEVPRNAEGTEIEMSVLK